MRGRSGNVEILNRLQTPERIAINQKNCRKVQQLVLEHRAQGELRSHFRNCTYTLVCVCSRGVR